MRKAEFISGVGAIVLLSGLAGAAMMVYYMAVQVAELERESITAELLSYEQCAQERNTLWRNRKGQAVYCGWNGQGEIYISN